MRIQVSVEVANPDTPSHTWTSLAGIDHLNQSSRKRRKPMIAEFAAAIDAHQDMHL